MNIAALLLSFLVAQLDLSKVTKDDIVKTVEHMQRLNHELMDKLAVVEKENHGLKLESIKAKQSIREEHDSAVEAKADLAAIQTTVDKLVIAKDNAEAGEKAEAARKWKFMKLCLALGIIDLALLGWIFKKPLARLCGIPIP